LCRLAQQTDSCFLSGRQWKPIHIVKEWGASSPKLFGFMNSGGVLPEVCIEFGGSDQWLSLLNAQITAISRASVEGKLQERLTLTVSVRATHLAGGACF
jgi:hypothetical protein